MPLSLFSSKMAECVFKVYDNTSRNRNYCRCYGHNLIFLSLFSTTLVEIYI